jgi:hypothetical protein
MRLAGKIFGALFFTIFLGRAEAATEWVKLYRYDTPMPEWIKITTEETKGQVVGIYDNAFTIDVGTDLGARIGGLYLVYSERIPHKGKEPVAVLRVFETAQKYSLCDMTSYVNGMLVRVGDKIVPAAVSTTQEVSGPAVIHQSTVTEGYISQGGPGDGPIPEVYHAAPPAAIPSPVVTSPAPVTYAAPEAFAGPATVVSPPVMTAPVPAVPPPAAVMPAETLPGPIQYNYPPAGAPAPYQPQYQTPQPYQPQPGTQYAPNPPAPAASPFPGNVTYPPYPNYQDTAYTQLEFDANKIADARLIRTFPLSQPDMNALEIQFRGGMQLYSARRYYEAFEMFMRQTSFPGNYLSPYWAGMSALRIGDTPTAVNLFNNSLSINPYYEPARNGLISAQRPVSEQPKSPAQPPRRTKRK